MKTKNVTIKVPVELLEKMSKYKKEEGVNLGFQFCKGAEMFLKEKGN